MKPQDETDKANRARQGAQREKTFREAKIKAVELLCTWLDAGKSLEEVAIDLDIRAAGGAVREGIHQVCHEGLEIIRQAREQGADHNEVLAHLRELERKHNAPAGENNDTTLF